MAEKSGLGMELIYTVSVRENAPEEIGIRDVEPRVARARLAIYERNGIPYQIKRTSDPWLAEVYADFSQRRKTESRR
jgi:hypothetical protein